MDTMTPEEMFLYTPNTKRLGSKRPGVKDRDYYILWFKVPAHPRTDAEYRRQIRDYDLLTAAQQQVMRDVVDEYLSLDEAEALGAYLNGRIDGEFLPGARPLPVYYYYDKHAGRISQSFRSYLSRVSIQGDERVIDLSFSVGYDLPFTILGNYNIRESGELLTVR